VHTAQLLELPALTQSSYIERVFIKLWKIDKDDHCKGRMIFHYVKERHANIPQELTKMINNVYLHCICLPQRKHPIARIKNIVTKELGVRGMVDLIIFQSMLDGDFGKILSNLNHGIKKLTLIPHVFKNASSIVYTLSHTKDHQAF
jgi:hypothetical protein